MFGAHLSIAGGLHHALLSARTFGMECVQIFTQNQKQWSPPPLSDQAVRLWRQHVRDTGIAQAVSHDSYLINLASPDAAMWERSIAAFRAELRRCEALGVQHLVTHPGAHMGAGEEAGLRRVVQALDRLHADLPGLKVRTCLEITAGQGTSLGYRFEHLAHLLGAVRRPERLAVCLDTAHLLAAGYDLTRRPGAQATLQQCEQTIGLRCVAVLHVNDSRTPRGSRVDRHAHLGQGHIAATAFAEFLSHPGFAGIPKILETPKGKAPDGRDWDAINLAALRRLARPTGRVAPG